MQDTKETHPKLKAEYAANFAGNTIVADINDIQENTVDKEKLREAIQGCVLSVEFTNNSEEDFSRFIDLIYKELEL